MTLRIAPVLAFVLAGAWLSGVARADDFPVTGLSAPGGEMTFCDSGEHEQTSDPLNCASAPLVISGSPPTNVVVGDTYAFQPAVQAAPGAQLTFSATNLPAWTTLNPVTGQITGTPDASQVGSYANIQVAVTDGQQAASLPAFSIAVTDTAPGAATLTWTPPTQNVDGSPLTDLAGYQILYGTNAAALDHTIAIPTPGITAYIIGNLTSGTWYFAMKSVTASNLESALSNVVSKTI